MPYAAKHRREKMREYYLANRKRLDRQSREWGYDQRDRVIALLGGKCARCGIADKDVLAVDHTFGGGCQERRAHPSQRTVFARILRFNPIGEFQLLCHNCNWKKRLEDARA